MSDDKARAILRDATGFGAWITWDDETDCPDWHGRTVCLDGDFSASELLAILHFAPKEGQQP